MKYHVGLIHGGISGNEPEKVTVQMRRDVDFLSCGLWEYIGVRDTTKRHVKESKQALLGAINETYGTSFTKIAVD